MKNLKDKFILTTLKEKIKSSETCSIAFDEDIFNLHNKAKREQLFFSSNEILELIKIKLNDTNKIDIEKISTLIKDGILEITYQEDCLGQIDNIASNYFQTQEELKLVA